jgi:hypothetical protein
MFKRLSRSKLDRVEETLTNKEFEKFSRSQLQQLYTQGYEFIK